MTALAADGRVLAVDAHSLGSEMPSIASLLRIPNSVGADRVMLSWAGGEETRDALLRRLAAEVTQRGPEVIEHVVSRPE